MDERIDELLGRLDEAITQKCRELKRKRQYRFFDASLRPFACCF
jgi:hypothetical protein